MPHLFCYKQRTSSVTRHLVRKSTTNARHLVAGTIVKTLQPTARRYYPVWGWYGGSVANTSGFIASATTANQNAVGRACISEYVNPQHSYIGWQTLNSSYDWGMAWYQGAYATSATSNINPYESVEAFMQMAAYRFDVPDSYKDSITKARVVFKNGGCALCHGAARGGDSWDGSMFVDWEGGGDEIWASFALRAGTAALPRYSQLAGLPTTYADMSDPGPYSGARDLWGFTGSGRDGYIPTLLNPDDETTGYYNGNPFLSSGSYASTLWVIPYFGASITSQSYNPYYYASRQGDWVCASLWGVRLEVTIG